MVSEFDLPCADCQQQLVETQLRPTEPNVEVTVAECPECGGYYYPESALERL